MPERKKEPRLERRQPPPLAPAEVEYMPLMLRSLATLIRLKGKTISPRFLTASLAGAGRLNTAACLRAASRAGFQGKALYRAGLDDISPLTLPCLLLLKNDHTCVLLKMDPDFAEIILPENGEEMTRIARADLAEQYSGFTIFGALENRVDGRIEKLTLTGKKHWFWSVLRYFAPVYRHVAAAGLIVNLIAVASPLFVMNVYDRVVPNNALETLWVLAVGITVVYFFDFILKTLRTYFVDIAGRNADILLSGSLLDKVLTMRMEAKPESTGALVNNLREFESLREFFSSASLLTLIDLPFLLIFLMIIYSIGGPLVLLPILAMPAMLSAGLILQLRAKRSVEQRYKHNMQKSALLTEIVNGLETVKSSMAESRMQRLWEEVINVSAEAAAEAHKYNNLAVSVSAVISQIMTVAMMVWGVYLIGDGLMTMGGLIGCNILLGRAMAPLLQVASLLTRLENALVSLSALNTVMDLPSENHDERSCMDYGVLRPAFSLEDVTFAYPGSERSALNGVSLTIRPGEKVGVIGRMGSGKSTLGKLMIGLYEPKEGAVKLDGVDIRQLAVPDLRGRVGMLPQEVVLFYGTVRDNIALGDPTIPDHLVVRAAELAGASDFIRHNPAGFGAQVGEQGRNLSGGQRQALGLARALVRDPEILILDEPTGNMDAGSEHTVQRRLQSVMRDKTLILITHRLSMLKIVDRVVVLDGGRILHDGPKAEVLKTLHDPKTKGAEAGAPGGKTARQLPGAGIACFGATGPNGPETNSEAAHAR